MSQKHKLVTIKVGTHVITNADGLPDKEIITGISSQIAKLKKQGYQVVLVSSGAVAAGRSIFPAHSIQDTIELRQVLSSVGQVELITLYKGIFDKLNVRCSQVLVTKEDFKSRNHYLNMKNCLKALLNNNIVPIINENDVVSINELMFTDNDELAGLVSAMIDADRVIILTNVDGIYDGDPNNSESEVISLFDTKRFKNVEFSAGKQSEFGRGGVLTKCAMAKKIAGMGIPVHIANGRTDDIILNILDKNPPGTLFEAQKSTSSIKKYIAHAYDTKGKVVINQGAKEALKQSTANSLLPVGVTSVIGDFKKGDVVRIEDELGVEIGLGIARFDAEKASEIKGLKNMRPMIHYDHLYLH